VLAFLLAATAVPMAIAVRATRDGALSRARLALAVAVAVQAGFFAMQISLFYDDLDRFSPRNSAYGSIYFTVLGAHLVHVAAGLLLVAWLLGKLTRGLTGYRIAATEAIAFYWYFVDLLALLVVAAQLSARV
jgi:heme/copper-type cytochrome/quinol oxidase subunit 3